MTQPQAQLAYGIGRATGEDLYPTVGQVHGMAGNIELLRPARGSGAEEYALHSP